MQFIDRVKELRRKQLGVRIHRQAVFLGFILDFWCPAAQLAIEIDGECHDLAKDGERDRILMKTRGVMTLRYSNALVLESSDAVLRDIAFRVKLRSGMT